LVSRARTFDTLVIKVNVDHTISKMIILYAFKNRGEL
jgi:hypothetical protein